MITYYVIIEVGRGGQRMITPIYFEIGEIAHFDYGGGVKNTKKYDYVICECSLIISKTKEDKSIPSFA